MSIENLRDLEGITRASSLATKTLTAMATAVRVGITTGELDAIAKAIFDRYGAHSAPRAVYGFPGNVLISINDQVVHGVPGARRLENDDVVKLDVTVDVDGYVADTARTVMVGRGSRRARALAACAEEAFYSGLSVARAGNRVCEIGREIERTVKARGFTVIRSLTGHGVGRTIHEAPTVPNYYDTRQADILTLGLVITIEPLICDGREQVYEDADGWTIRTRDGSIAAHYEHTILITAGTPVVLT